MRVIKLVQHFSVCLRVYFMCALQHTWIVYSSDWFVLHFNISLTLFVLPSPTEESLIWNWSEYSWGIGAEWKQKEKLQFMLLLGTFGIGLANTCGWNTFCSAHTYPVDPVALQMPHSMYSPSCLKFKTEVTDFINSAQLWGGFSHRQRSSLRTGDSGVSWHVADATGARFLSSRGSVSTRTSHHLPSLPPAVSITIKSTTKTTWHGETEIRVKRVKVTSYSIESTKEFFSACWDCRYMSCWCLKVSVFVSCDSTFFFTIKWWA